MSEPQRPAAAHRLLDQLVGDPLDPGYAQAAQHRKSSGGSRRWYDAPALALGCLLAGFALVVAYVHTNRGAPEAQQVHDDLVNRVRAAEQGVASLGAQVDQLDQQLARARANALPSAGSLVQNLQRDQLLAGTVAVQGPGVTVTLAEPPAPSASSGAGRGGTTPIGATSILTDRDVRSVVNELWRDGAEAVAVNDIRLTPTSAIRFAGQAVLVDFQPISPPYTVAAIGNADALDTGFAESAVASRYQTLAGLDGIGFSFGESSQLNFPAGAPVAPRYATPSPARSGR